MNFKVGIQQANVIMQRGLVLLIVNLFLGVSLHWSFHQQVRTGIVKSDHAKTRLIA